MQLLAFTGHGAKRWEPKRLRYRIFTIAAQLARQVLLHLATRSPWAGLIADAIHRLRALVEPG